MSFIRYTLSLFLLLTVGCADTTDREDTVTPDTEEATDGMVDVADDLAALESPYVETPLRNDYIDVHRVDLPAGNELASHEGGARVIYSLGSYTLRFETDGASETQSFAEGDVHYHDAGVHSVANTGDTDATYVVFERRDAALPTTEAEGETEVSTPGEGTTDEIVFENDFAEVHRVTLQPNAQLPPHQGYARAVYSLSGYLLEFEGEDGTREQRFEAGEAHYHDPGDHTVENAGDTVAEFLVVEFK
jgi:hypothetical protein